MKPKKQQSSSASDRKPSGGGSSSGAAPTTAASLGTAGTEAKSTPTNSSSSTATSTAPPTKKPVKRLQSKAKESAASTSQTAAAGPGSAATVAPPAAGGGKSSEKPSSTVTATSGAAASSGTVQSNKSKSAAVAAAAASGGKGTAATPSTAIAPNTEPAKDSNDGTVATESGANAPSSSAPLGSASGNSETSAVATPPSKGNKGVAKTIKSDSIGTTAQTQGSATKGAPKEARKSTKGGTGTGAGTKKAASQAEKSDAGKRKQSSVAAGTTNPAPASSGAGGPGESRPQAAATSGTPTATDSKLREKEKKIQKELKNLGVPDKTINQSIDAAYLLESVESVVNPSISEMVKTKSRTTVAQGKYGGGGGGDIITIGGGVPGGRKSSITSEDPPASTEAEAEKQPKESVSTGTAGTGKVKKSVTLKLDHQPEEGPKPTKSSGKGVSAKESSEKAAPKAGRKDEKASATAVALGAATASASKSSSKATGQGGKSSKKANNLAGPTDSKQKKTSGADHTAKNTEQQKKDTAAIEAPMPVVKQSSEQDCSSAAIGNRGSSVEQEDHEEQKNEEVHIRIDSIVKALEREDIETTPAGAKKDLVDDALEAAKEDGPAVAAPPGPLLTTPAKGSTDGKAKKQPASRKPPVKKEGTAASSKSKAKEANDKKKAPASAPVDAPDKKEVKFQEQTPTSPAKRKYVKKPKSSAGSTAAVVESVSGEKPVKIAKSTSAKKAPAAASKAKQAEAKGSSKIPAAAAANVPSSASKDVDSSKDDKTPDNQAKPPEPSSASAVGAGRDRSSTENDDDLPLRQLQQKQNQAQPAREPAVQSTEKSTTTEPTSSQVVGQEKASQQQPSDKEKEDRTNSGSGGANAPNATGPILAGLLKSSAKQGKRPYVRKNASAGGGGSKASKTTPTVAVHALGHPDETKERKLEKKDVYDFDDSESEIETPVKPGKPSFKRKSSMDISQSREDISRDATDDPDPPKAKTDVGSKHEETPLVAEACGVEGEGEKAKRTEPEPAKRTTVPLKKQKRRIEAVLSESLSSAPNKEQKGGASSASEKEQDDDAAGVECVVAPEAKVKKKATPPASRRHKQEPKDDSQSSADEADDDDDDDDGVDGRAGVGDDNESADSDGCSSTDTVRTRIAKKRQSAKKRNVKLYGFWSGPKRHRVASLNALAKVHCLYENEMRGALEASLMSQSSGSRVIRTITKDGERIKKERICPDEDSAGEESRSGETGCGGESTEQTRGKEPEQSKAKDAAERKDGGEKKKGGDEKKDSVKQERKEAPSQQQQQQQPQQQQKQSEGTARDELKAKVKEEAPKKDSDQDSAESSEEEPVVARNLRYVPGLRGAGKHWDPDASSLESEIEQLPDSDETYAQGKDTDPTRKRKIKKKVVRKSKAKTAAAQAKIEKSEKDKEKSEKAIEKAEKPPKPPVKKIKKELKALLTDNERQDDGAASSSSTASEKVGSAKTKPADDVAAAKKRKREPKCEPGGDYKDYIGKKRMASLNATAMLAATYEVQRVLYRNTDSSDSESSAEKAAPKPKKTSKELKEQKENAAKEAAAKAAAKTDTAGEKDSRAGEVVQSGSQPGASGSPVDSKQVDMVASLGSTGTSQPSTSSGISVAQQEVLTKKKKVVIKTEPMRDRKDDPMEVKREIEEPRPVSSNLVIAQDTEVTITGVYVNSSLGTNQEAYCKMQYRVQQSVTEERLVRPGEAPPKSYTPLSALSSMRPPNDQALSTPPLFVPPAQCDSPLGPPRAFYPPPTSSSGSSSAFCAPMPHDSPGYYQPAGPLISPHLLGQPPTAQHGPKSGTDGDTLLAGPPQPPASSTADSTDSDVLLTGGGADPAHRTHPYGSSRYGPTAGVGGAGGSGGGAPPANLYPRPMQMHCPPATYLPPGYYAPSPYGPQPPPPHGPPPEMYYTHAYPAHFYPKFAPPYYPTTRRYYTGPPGPGPEHHMYEQAPPPTSAQGPPGPGPPPPPPSGAQLVPAGPQGPQHLEHYPYPPYPGYGSPGPGSGGQCYSRNLQHPPPPPPYMDAHYTTNCPCPMQCPKNVNAGSLIGIKASKGPVATNNHIVQNQTTSARMSLPEPITISSSSSSASSSSSPAPVDIHSPVSATAVAAAVTTTATTVASQPTVGNIEPVASTMAAAKQQPPHLSQHGYHAHHHHGAQPMELHPSANHVLAHPYQYHYHHPGYGPSLPPAEVPQKPAVTSTSTAAVTTSSAIAKQQPPAAVVTTAGSDHPEKMCYKTEQLIKPEAPGELHPTPMHYASPYHHYQYPMGYYHPPHHHHAKLPDLKEEPHGTLTPPYSITSKMALLDTAEMSPARLSSSADGHPAKVSDCGDKVRGAEADDKLTNIPVSTIVKQEIEEFKLLEPLVGTICKKEDFEETGPAMTPDLLDEAIVIKRDRDEVKLATSPAFEHHLQQRHLQHHHLHHHHSASTNLLHGPPHHHQLHSRYSSMQQQQQKPLITGLLVEKDDGESDAKLPPDSKSLLTELVLTTEASMVEPPEAATTTTTAKSTTLEVELLSRVDAAAQQQAGGTSSDSSLSLSDSLTPRTAAGAAEQLNRISKDTVEQVQSHDSGLDPPSPVPIPASTVKRRPLLVACKKPTPKQSPPNSYKNLIKRTNGGVSDAEDAREPECPEPVELSEEEEEEEDDEEEEEEEEEDDEEEEEDDEEEDTEALLEKDVEDVEDIELQEQRKVEAEKRALLDVSRASQESAGRKQHIRKRAVSKRKPASNVRKFPSTSGTPQDKLHRKQQSLVSKKWASSKAVARSAKRLHRVFRSNIESLKRLPAALRERLLRRSNITFVPIRRTVRKRLNRSQLVLETAEHENSEMPESITDRADEMGLSKLNDTEPTPLPPTELAIPTDASKVAESCSGVTSSTSPTSNVTIPPLSNVDRTIDLVAKGYFSEPEILTCPERTWLKKLKQQQEGRSLSEQSRGAAAKRTGEGTSKKCKAKCSLEVPTPNAVAPVPSEKCKKSKSKSKSSKAVAVPVSDIEPEEPVPKSSKTATEGKKSKSKKKANAKERKKSEPSSRKRKQKEQPDEEEVSHAPNRKRSSKEQDSLALKTGEALYLRATSTPIPPSAGEMLPVPGQVDRELSDAADRKAGGVLDDSVVTLMDQSSVIDDRETDFDDAATMLVEDDVASVDTSVLINRHHHNNNNNNNSAITDKNNLAEEQQRVDQIVLAAPLQAIIAEGKEGSELEPPEGMEPFMDEQLDEDEAIAASQLQVTVRQSVEVVQPVAPSMDLPLDPVHATYDDEYEELEEEELQPKRGSSRSVKRRRSRSKTKSKKFSTKKRHRPSLRAEQQLLQEIIVPKRCTTIPRWSNGWTWEGQPFQGKVFLNSDDPPVLRTCYPAMRHSVGDIIKPRDCVLLKAGSKRAELPYVAKVAHLWENPDDGEMMMSLLWYYRPEHTEQGRQRTDGPDEVFASRHKDHNSVACIEDKCYVLTFSEYCRFRRQLKGYEENIEEQPSIVPPLRRENPRLPPPIVSPELVMYCQRVYEFRQKRLLKSTS